jgi:hypothetical protein
LKFVIFPTISHTLGESEQAPATTVETLREDKRKSVTKVRAKNPALRSAGKNLAGSTASAPRSAARRAAAETAPLNQQVKITPRPAHCVPDRR